MQVGGNTAHVVVNRWQNRNRLLAHIHTCKDASRLGNARQALLDHIRAQVLQMQLNVVLALADAAPFA